MQDYEEIAGHGIQAPVGNGRTVLAGNDRLLHRENIPHDVCTVEGTVAHIAIEGKYSGRIMIADELKEDAADAIKALQSQGIKTAMLTGDSQSVAEQIAQQLGLDQYRAELLPEDKVDALEMFLHQARQAQAQSCFCGRWH